MDGTWLKIKWITRDCQRCRTKSKIRMGLAVQTRLDHLRPAVRFPAYLTGSHSESKSGGGQHGTLRPLGPPTSMACCTLLCCPPVLTQLLWDFKTHRETCAEDRSGPAVVLLDGTEIGRSLIVGKTLFLSITCRSLPVWEGNWRLWSEIRGNWRERNRVSPVTEWLNLGSSSKSRFVINVKC